MKRSIWAWARVLGGVTILAVLLWRLGTGAFLDGLRLIDATTLGAALAIGVATTVFSAWRWCLVARGLGLRLPLRAAIADYYKALFINAALPGGILGDVDRAVQHGREEGDVGKSVRAVVLERTAGQVVLVTAGLAVLLTVPSPVLTQLRAHLPAAGITVAALAVAALASILAVGKLRSGASRWAQGTRTALAEVRSGLLSRRSWPGIMLASTVVLAGHLATFVVAAHAAGSHAPVLKLAPLMLLALLAMTLPVNIGGWGPREAVTAWAFGAAGLSAAQGLTIAVIYGLFAFVAALPGIVVIGLRALATARARRAATPAVAVVPAAPASVPAAPAPVALRIVPARPATTAPIAVRQLVGTGA
ncbi:lysylphosphatidylglycerol synthase transmembrane domain-containing protein [Actinoplanes sp. TFC3]|uniref:lysylphosphatidylglycerol synthase transmembrane domain-containing protein n=1 Tax=Actinoplanes sp. TFC3 TaxID=1710355 RepID=UPI000829CF92|nr:lysylphosphatidylglycerol synthase transmembrane domain-containing protein [Actinoplanes sp. TFC3]